MIIQHKDLSDGRWGKMTLCEQLANVGSEISRALNWKNKNNDQYSKKALFRALELLEFTIDAVDSSSKYRELTRLRELIVDYFIGDNEFSSTEELWRSYFDHFNYAARRST